MKMLIWIILIFLAIFILINILYKNTNHYKNSIANVKKFIDGVPNNLEIINLGSSYSMYGYSYDDIPLNGFNMALSPQSFMYDFKILKQYSSYLSEGCIVLLNITILSFGENENYKDDMINHKYYHFLKKDKIENYSLLKYLKIIYFPLLFKPSLVSFIIKDSVKNNDFSVQYNQYKLNDITKIANNRLAGWSNSFNLNNMIEGEQVSSHLEAVKEKKTILENMINYCYEKGFRPVIVIPPVSGILRDKISNEFVKSFLHQNIENIEVPILDYWFDEEFKDKEFYIHCDFLNAKGREKFTKKVLEDLKL